MSLVHGLALLGGALNVGAFCWYNVGVLRGSIRPSAAAWFLWAVVTGVQVSTFQAAGAHWTAIVTMGTDSFLCIGTFLFLAAKSKFGKIDGWSWRIIAISLGAVVAWILFSATLGNVLSQIPYGLAFVPIMRDLRDGTTKDDPAIWLTFTLSFTVSLTVVALTWENASQFISPIVAIALHAIVARYAFKGRHSLPARAPANDPA